MERREVLKQLGAAGLVAACPAVSYAQAVSSDQYVTLPQRRAGQDDKKIEVMEFFHYGCPHCRNFDPMLHHWVEGLPEDIVFSRQPAVWGNKALKALAKLYFTIDSLGLDKQLHMKVFVAVQDDKAALYEEPELEKWIKAQPDIDGEKFMATYHSFALPAKVQRADELAREFQVSGVPALVIDGHFMVSASKTGSHQNTLKVADALLADIRKKRQK